MRKFDKPFYLVLLSLAAAFLPIRAAGEDYDSVHRFVEECAYNLADLKVLER